MKKLSISKDREKTVQRRIDRLSKDAGNYEQLKEFYLSFEDNKLEQENNPEWQKNNLEYDLRSSEYIVEKCKNKAYAQNIYAALCNNEFIKNDVVQILTENTWSCTWRYAGGIVSDLVGQGDYLDWYCSGIRHDDGELTHLYVGEGDITDEIKEDLFKLGWLVVDTPD